MKGIENSLLMLSYFYIINTLCILIGKKPVKFGKTSEHLFNVLLWLLVSLRQSRRMLGPLCVFFCCTFFLSPKAAKNYYYFSFKNEKKLNAFKCIQNKFY